MVWYCVGGSLYAFCVFLGCVCICIWTFAVLGMMVRVVGERRDQVFPCKPAPFLPFCVYLDFLYLKPNSPPPAGPHFSMLPTARMLGWASGCQRLVKGHNQPSSSQVCWSSSLRASVSSSNRSRCLVVFVCSLLQRRRWGAFLPLVLSPLLSLPFSVSL